MCGLAGFLDLRRRFSNYESGQLVSTMTDRLVHRGPDDSGIWTDEHAGIALGFRRLSIIDLSAAGAQPMVSATGSSVLIYNGEVYNPEALKPELEGRGIRFRGHSDTEVILEAFEQLGVVATA